MTDVSQLSKLAELRQKTDHELVGLLTDGLELGFHLARVAAEKNNAASDSAKSYEQAEAIAASNRPNQPGQMPDLENKEVRLHVSGVFDRQSERVSHFGGSQPWGYSVVWQR